MAASGQAAVVGKGFGKSHADAGADAGSHADKEGGPTVVRGESGTKQWRKSRDGTVHETGESGLDDLQNE
jgi:hypothetical protein